MDKLKAFGLKVAIGIAYAVGLPALFAFAFFAGIVMRTY